MPIKGAAHVVVNGSPASRVPVVVKPYKNATLPEVQDVAVVMAWTISQKRGKK